TTLTWPQAPTSVVEVIFYYQDVLQDGSFGAPIVIGTDSNPADGAAIVWEYIGEFHGGLTARASMGGAVPTAITAQALIVWSQAEEEPEAIGQVVADTGTWGEDDTWELPYEDLTTLAWPEAPTDAVEILFFYQHFGPDGNLGAPIWIGTDDDPADGASITWEYHGEFHGGLTAHATLGGDIPTAITVEPLYVRSQAEATQEIGQVVADSGAWGDDGNWMLPYDGETTLTWPEAPATAAEVHFFYQHVQQDGSVDAPIWIGTDDDLAGGASIDFDYNGAFQGVVRAEATLGGDIPFAVTEHDLPVASYPDVPGNQGTLSVEPPGEIEGEAMQLIIGTTVTLNWELAPQDATHVEFYITATSAGDVLLGTDDDPADGASIVFTVPEYDYLVALTATALMADGREIHPLQILTIATVTGPIGGQGTLTTDPPGRVEGGWTYLPIGEEVQIVWQNAPTGFERVEFAMAPTGTGITPTPIGTDTDSSDGVSVPWQVLGGSGHIMATAYFADGHEIMPEGMLQFVGEGDAPNAAQ
ncbi:MAG: hypothetical protein JW910_09205, partial [Anaerolineae bacterium]|nr:hypothetical protein [Anaerolineae bacterium]